MQAIAADTPSEESRLMIEGGASERWIGRPWAARGVRALVYIVPFATSVLAAYIVSSAIPAAPTIPVAIARLVLIGAIATVALRLTDRVMRRLMPLAALLDLTLVFPDRAPSRYKIAARSGTTVQLERRLSDYHRSGAEGPARAAEHLLELVGALSKHDRMTRGHSERVRAYSQMIGEEMGISGTELDHLRWAGLIHDVGKLRIAPAILNKPGKLTDEEYEIIKLHPEYGAELAAPLAGWLGESVLAVVQHHERWDGNGYPRGLAGTEISLAARIVSVADVFDVITSVRSYKRACSPVAARQELARCAGTQFDPAVVRAFLNVSVGRLRMAIGPLSWLTQLALFPQPLLASAAAPGAHAVTTFAGLATAGVGAVAIADTVIPAPAAVIAEAGEDLTSARQTLPVSAGDLVVTALSTSAEQAAHDSGPVLTAAAPEPARPRTGDPEATTTSSSAPADEPLAGGGSDDPDTGTGSPPAVAPTGDTTPAETTTTTAPATSTTTTTTTTAPPSTTTPRPPPPTTSVVPPSVGVYLLGSSGVGDVASQPVLPLVQRAPLNLAVINLDTERNNDPWLQIARDGDLVIDDPAKIQRFTLDPPGNLQLGQSVILDLYAAPKDLSPSTVALTAALVNCKDSTQACTVIEQRGVTFAGTLGLLSPIRFDFGAVRQTIAANHHLEIWIVVPNSSADDVWIAYDSDLAPSALTIVS